MTPDSILSDVLAIIAADVQLLQTRLQKKPRALSVDESRRLASYAAFIKVAPTKPPKISDSLQQLLERAKKIPALVDALRLNDSDTVLETEENPSEH